MSQLKTRVSDEVTRDRRGTAPEDIAGDIRNSIGRGVLAPNLQLRQEELAARFSVSRVPVREALKILAAEGFVNHDPRRGFFVAPVSSEEMQDLYLARRLLESELLRTLEWPTHDEIAALEQNLDDMEVAAAASDINRYAGVHHDFHNGVFDLSPRKVLKREAMRLWALTDRYRSLRPRRVGAHSVKRERELLDLIKAKNRDGLLTMFEEDRRAIEASLLSVLAERGL